MESFVVVVVAVVILMSHTCLSWADFNNNETTLSKKRATSIPNNKKEYSIFMHAPTILFFFLLSFHGISVPSAVNLTGDLFPWSSCLRERAPATPAASHCCQSPCLSMCIRCACAHRCAFLRGHRCKRKTCAETLWGKIKGRGICSTWNDCRTKHTHTRGVSGEVSNVAYLLTENIISKTHVGLPRKKPRGEGKTRRHGDRWGEGGGDWCMTLWDVLKLRSTAR